MTLSRAFFFVMIAAAFAIIDILIPFNFGEMYFEVAQMAFTIAAVLTAGDD